jgi:hypothetical protein
MLHKGHGNNVLINDRTQCCTKGLNTMLHKGFEHNVAQRDLVRM